MYLACGKRFADLIVGLCALVLLSPMILAVAVLIRVFDPGPVLFRQERVGADGRLFLFYKFRSMPVNTENVSSEQLGTVDQTWVGKFIRRANLDELPQLFNIVRGDMSVVGPRPPISSQVDLIEYRRKNGALQCRPGLTGLAQVNSYDGMTAAEKAAFDGRYAENISFLGDVKIVLSTFGYLLKPPPVY